MGIYLNPDNEGFFTSVRSKIYIDKTDLIRLDMQLIRSTAMNEGYKNEMLLYLQEKKSHWQVLLK